MSRSSRDSENTDSENTDSKNSDSENSEGGDENSGRKECNPVYVRPADQKELERVVAARDGFKSVPHLLREYLSRSLIPRIEEGRCFPRRLLAATTGRVSSDGTTGGRARTKLKPGLENWEPVEATARKLTGALRRLEERRAWKGGAGALPFCRCGRAEVVRAAAREIAVWSRGGPPELFSQEEASEWLGPGRGTQGRETSGRESHGRESQGQEESDQETSSREATYQVLPIRPGEERGGKGVHFYVTADAKRRLKRKGDRLGQTGTDLARRATRLLVGWAEEAPVEALRYIAEESDLYRKPRDGETSGFQVYVATQTKRRVERTVARLRRGPGQGERPNQQTFLQAAARLAIEADDEDMRPPLPGAETDR